MKKILFFLLGLFLTNTCYSQSDIVESIPPLEGRNSKNSIYVYWGWNWDGFTKSDITFTGVDYEFTLYDVIADDKQAGFSVETYFHPEKFTIPQYNFRVGYFFRENWDISFGVDHMKYVVRQNQEVRIEGHINDPESIYNGIYDNDLITIQADFLKYEHTDGLNYANFELRHTNNVLEKEKVTINLIEGFGVGALIPRTNATFLGNDRHDEFHLAGYGLGGMIGVHVLFFERFFIQSELKGGFIGLPDVRTTISETDKASQSFFYSQYNIVFGATMHL